MSTPHSHIGKLYVELHTAEQDLAREHARWQGHQDYTTTYRYVYDEEKERRLFKNHKQKVVQLTDRINGLKAQIAASS
jgi:hypothetical protein